MGKSKKFTNAFKAKVALEALKENKTITQISSEFGVHSSRVSEWTKIAKQNLNSIFSKKNHDFKKEYEQEIDQLYKNLGKLTVENEFLKKKLYC